MEVDLSPEEREALKEKEKGNAAYKKKDFETAIKHYDKAIELNPTNMTYLNNKAGEYETSSICYHITLYLLIIYRIFR